MALWFDAKGKSYAGDHTSSWLKAYVEQELEKNARQSEENVQKEEEARIAADKSLHAEIEQEKTERAAAMEEEVSLRQAEDGKLQTALSAHRADEGNPHGVTKAQVGLGNAENTSDLDKPVSTATQAAINAEKVARENADTVLQSKIDTETTARTAADAELQERTTGISQRLQGEIEERTELFTQMGERHEEFRAEFEELRGTDNELAEALRTAAQERDAADAQLQAAIDTETSARTAADTALETAVAQKVDTSAVLTKTNTEVFTPSGNYQPATKKYVDDSVSAAGGGDMLKSVYDADSDGKVNSAEVADNADKLGGQLPSYYAVNVPFYDADIVESYDGAAWIQLWSIDAQNLPNRFNVRLMNNDLIIPQTSGNITYNMQLYFLSCANGGDPAVEVADYERYVKVYSYSGQLTNAYAHHMSLIHGYTYQFEWKADENTYVLLNPMPMARNVISPQNAYGFGLSRVVNSLSRSEFNQGEALSAYQGKVLKDMIDSISVFPEKPTLTALTPVGTTVGSPGWTGTGEFNTNAGANNSHNVFSSIIGLGYMRLNLKLASGENWQEWSAYYDKDGEEFPLYYSEARGVYDGVIPDEGLTLQQTIDKIRWVYRRKPETIIYGSFGSIVITPSSGTDYVISTDIGVLRQETGSGRFGVNSEKMALLLFTNSDLIESQNLPTPLLAKIALVAGVCGTNHVNNGDTGEIYQLVQGTKTIATISSIDNWGA